MKLRLWISGSGCGGGSIVRRNRSRSRANGAYFAGLEVTSVSMEVLGRGIASFANQGRRPLRDDLRPVVICVKKPHLRALTRQPAIELLFARVESRIGRQIIQEAGRAAFAGNTRLASLEARFQHEREVRNANLSSD